MYIDFETFPVLTTRRLVLRQIAITDAVQLHNIRSNPEVNKYVDRPPSTGIADAEAFIQKITNLVNNNESIYWVITTKESDVLIGTVCLWNFDIENQTIEIGYELLPDHQGKGIMAEAVAEVIKYGFEVIQARIITAFPSANNDRSVSLLEKFNFTIDSGEYVNTHGDVDGMLVYVLKRKASNIEH